MRFKQQCAATKLVRLSKLFFVLSITLGVLQQLAHTQDWCGSPTPDPPPGLKKAGIQRFEIPSGSAGGSSDPKCPPAACVELKAGIPRNAIIQEVHLCAGDMGPNPYHECFKVVASPVWWDCKDNPPYARFFPDITVTQPSGAFKYATVTFKNWASYQRKAKFVILYKLGSTSGPPTRSNQHH